MLSYDEFDQILRTENLMVSAAELHGVLSGLLCGGIETDSATWQAKLIELINDGHGLPIAIKNHTQDAFSAALTQLNGEALDFSPLQPSDDCSMRERLEALALWVQSFLVGFGVVRTDLQQADPDIQELIRDFSAISQLSLELDGSTEENEQAYMEVFEYVRLGAIACFEQFSKQQGPQNKPTLH